MGNEKKLPRRGDPRYLLRLFPLLQPTIDPLYRRLNRAADKVASYNRLRISLLPRLLIRGFLWAGKGSDVVSCVLFLPDAFYDATQSRRV